ncbi:uncharacterized protein LOC127264337 [Andrographis paniculata]|uniref:uncharacterized protein LOC127264337 n=1 Tax=Andrographis paniculata TaxID=175694 RepID=UPI0021E85390|nr:uncharacterized protein LOC127264337 [Andrographis paniculata]
MEDLSIAYPRLDILSRISTFLFAFDNLTHLCVENVVITLSPQWNGFGKLVKLELLSVSVELDELMTLLSKCPMLEYLDFECDHRRHYFMNYFINEEHTLEVLKSVKPINLTHLESVMISLLSGYVAEVEFIRNVLQWASVLKYMTLKSTFSGIGDEPNFSKMFLALHEVPQELPRMLNDLKTIKLRNVNFGIMDNVACVICLMRSSPKLYGLDINFDAWLLWAPRAEETYKAINYLKANQKQNINYNNLKIVIMKFVGIQPEMKFVKLLLLKGTELEQLKLTFLSMDDGELDKAKMELKLFY